MLALPLHSTIVNPGTRLSDRIPSQLTQQHGRWDKSLETARLSSWQVATYVFSMESVLVVAVTGGEDGA